MQRMGKEIRTLYVVKYYIIDQSDLWVQISIIHLAYLNQRDIPDQTVVFVDICLCAATDLRKKGIKAFHSADTMDEREIS